MFYFCLYKWNVIGYVIRLMFVMDWKCLSHRIFCYYCIKYSLMFKYVHLCVSGWEDVHGSASVPRDRGVDRTSPELELWYTQFKVLGTRLGCALSTLIYLSNPYYTVILFHLHFPSMVSFCFLLFCCVFWYYRRFARFNFSQNDHNNISYSMYSYSLTLTFSSLFENRMAFVTNLSYNLR